MTLDRFRPLADRAIEPFVDTATRLGVTPNGVSVVAFLVAAAAGGVYFLAGTARSLYLLGAVLVFLNGWLDLLDGALARRLGTDSRAGDLLDHALDRYADIVIVAGLAGGLERYSLGLAAVTGVLMTSYLGTQAEAVGLDREYGGLLGRADRLVVVVLVTTVAAGLTIEVGGLGLVALLLVVLAVVGHLTAIQRLVSGFRALS